MTGVPFLSVNVTALCCFALMFAAFLAAKKTPQIRAFLLVLLGFIFWTGGSILMRLQVWPGMAFWYYVSIEALFILPILIYLFVYTFTRSKGYFLTILWSIGTVILVAVTATGFFLQPPAVTQTAAGAVFSYHMRWPIAIPFLLIGSIVISIVLMFRRAIREKGGHAPGMLAIIAGCVAVTLGNLVQIIPGNTFPYDTLSGAVFAVLLLIALYRKRMFRMTLIVSRSILMVCLALICVLSGAYFITPTQTFFRQVIHLSEEYATVMVVVLFTLFFTGTYLLIRRVVDSLFTRDEQQGRLLKSFSASVSQTLRADEVLDQLSGVILAEIPAEQVYICLPGDHGFAVRHSSNPLSPASFVFQKESPCLNYLRQSGDAYFLLKEFMNTPIYLSLWEEEKELFRRLNLTFFMALRDGDEIVGLVLLGSKDRGRSFSYSEISFLETVGSIASIAVKNAGLYEKMYREARIDSLTGAYNYHYFVECVNETYSRCGKDGLALLYVDLDDFKLYNQLNGAKMGDEALRQIALVLNCAAEGCGTVFRTSGKVFALLLPGYDGRQACALAEKLQGQIGALDICVGQTHAIRQLSASCGICVAPHAAVSATELIENADLATYQAKVNGKNRVSVFRGGAQPAQNVEEQAQVITGQAVRGDDADYRTSLSSILALTAAIDAKDHYTYHHSQNVAHYASVLAVAAGLNDQQVRMIYCAGLLHDIGKISIPENILCKESRLSDEEYAVMKGHVANSMDMIRHLPSMDYLIPAAVGHHERWDGKGYPRGLAGDAIPVTARCLAIADAFDAMTTDRPYRQALTVEYAAQQIENGLGTQFDPQLGKLFVALLRTGQLKLQLKEAPV